MKPLLLLFACLFITAWSLVGHAPRAASRALKGRALLVGISEYAHPQVRPTRGAQEDAEATALFIQKQYGFAENEIKVLRGPEATADNIRAWFKRWLIEGTQAGDRVFFFYAGHGARLPDDANKDEDDGWDETLAPYDAQPGGGNFIRDDELGQWIAQLSGRLSVLVFDSCHSGTITRGSGAAKSNAAQSFARYLPTTSELAALGSTQTRSGNGAVDYALQNLREDDPRLLQTRDLKLVTAKAVGPATGIVVISAAQSGQVAFSMDVGGGQQRGALSYVFSQAQQEQPLTLSDLRTQLRTRIAGYQQAGKLAGKQEPEIEIISTIPLEDQPLFGTTLTIPAVALANPQSRVQLKLQTREGKTAYQFGETVSYQVETDTAGYLYLIVFSLDHETKEEIASVVFPNEYDRNNHVAPGKHTVPRPHSQPITVGAPAGKDTVVALLSATKLNLGEKEQYTWSEVFARLKDKRFTEFLRQTRGQTVRPPAGLTDWQAVSLVLQAIER